MNFRDLGDTGVIAKGLLFRHAHPTFLTDTRESTVSLLLGREGDVETWGTDESSLHADEHDGWSEQDLKDIGLSSTTRRRRNPKHQQANKGFPGLRSVLDVGGGEGIDGHGDHLDGVAVDVDAEAWIASVASGADPATADSVRDSVETALEKALGGSTAERVSRGKVKSKTKTTTTRGRSSSRKRRGPSTAKNSIRDHRESPLVLRAKVPLISRGSLGVGLFMGAPVSQKLRVVGALALCDARGAARILTSGAQCSDDPLLWLSIAILDHCGGRVATAMRFLTYAPLPASFHCTLGKDRTGALAALVLTLCGATRKQVVDDYVQSHGHLSRTPRGRSLLRSAAASMKGSLGTMTGASRSDEGTISGVLDHVESFGGTRAYLEKVGFAAHEQRILVERLGGEW